jgi:hypothetical protein
LVIYLIHLVVDKYSCCSINQTRPRSKKHEKKTATSKKRGMND